MSIADRLRTLLGQREHEVPGSPLPGPNAVIPIDRRARKRVNARRGTGALIIDDSKTIVVALRRMLETAGYIVSEAYDGATGLDMARRRRPDLVFLDIVMPGMNGFAVLRALRRDATTEAVPVIMMSGNEHATEQFFGSGIPADDFMKKPFSRLEVFARIEGLLDEQLVPQRRKPAVAAGQPPVVGRAS
jgi:twitching motility two-component system response regulator PilH